jgi:uncharacterized damage-inducible protein DinB
MTLVEILQEEADHMYRVTECLFRRVESDALAWKPPIGQNWMTIGQLLMHCTIACGTSVRGFITGDWGFPEGVRYEDLTPEEVLPPASKLPAVDSVEQALELLEQDRQLALAQLARLEEATLLGDRRPAPWGGQPLTLFQHLLNMIGHLGQHKGQLFYYLKLREQAVNTVDLWGM